MSLKDKIVETAVDLVVKIVMAAVDKALSGGSRADIEFEARIATHRMLVRRGGDLVLAAKAAAKGKVVR